MNTVSFLTLGCKVNQYDTDAMRGLFIKNGYTIVSPHEKSDVCVINTCSVTHIGEKKSRQVIRRAKRMNPDTLVVVTGCYAQLTPDTIASIDGVNIIIGTQDRHRIVEFVENYCPEKGVANHVKSIAGVRDFESLSLYGDEVEKTRAYIKIQEGCNNFCTFCIIPYTRGRLKSRQPAEIYDEVNRLVSLGYKEVVLTGIHLGNYGQDFENEIDLTKIVKGILVRTGIERIRLGSIESVEISDELIDLLANEKRLCPHLHLPLQSGSDAVLQMMRRHYTLQEYLKLVEHLRKRVPEIALTTDVILGFPGETETLFKESLDTLAHVGFADVHLFPYSKRSGTPAAKFPNQISEEEKKRRMKLARDVVDLSSKNYRDAFLGKQVEVLFEKRLENGQYEGYTSHYCRVRTNPAENLHTGGIYVATVTDSSKDHLVVKCLVEEGEA